MSLATDERKRPSSDVLRTSCGLCADWRIASSRHDPVVRVPSRAAEPSREPGGMAPSPNRLTAAGTQATGKHVRDVASSRPLILGGRHQPDYALTSGTFADTGRPGGLAAR